MTPPGLRLAKSKVIGGGCLSYRPSKLILTGPEWKGISDIVSIALSNDDTFRVACNQTLLRNRAQVETAQAELKEAVRKAKRWILYIEREGCDHLITIETERPGRHRELISGNEKLLLCAPKFVRVEATHDVLIGIADACCKAMGLHNALKTINEKLLSESGYELAKGLWNRCHLHWRRSVGARKAAWMKKGYVAEFEEVPDLRDSKFHEGAKLLYDVKEGAK